ncbi:hypothetical protein RFH42_09180 [Acinetobacter rudis]|uniref:hypothetical protein n=1 Tax=Acinetobacter rudis TaxID=632955 RepID=UPI00280CD48C|nr:hypothetical protein [Acinetobacter rudis]MDQ8953131.1 hypothetical protein [Acinetobacter rudis]
MLDINVKAEIGKSLAGLKLGSNLSMYLPYVDQIVDEHQVEWTIDIELDNKGILLYKFKDDESILYFSEPRLELFFSNKGILFSIRASYGYLGKIFEGGVKIGSRIGDIKHPLILDDTEDVHYLANGEDIIEGILFFAGGLEVDEDPDSLIEEVRVYDYSLK